MEQHVKEADPEKWHRYFAIECNNRAWDLAVQSRSPAEDEEMLNAAHASAVHWAVVGTELNQMRATMLLAEVHAVLGLGTTAIAYAEKMRDFFLSTETPDWEVAFTHAIHAHAASAAGDAEKHACSYGEAVKAIGAIESADERSAVEATFALVPAP